MSFVISLTDYRPSPRFDDLPWTEARLEGGAAEAGPFTEIETFTLDPVDADPADPASRSFTTEDAPDGTAWFRIVFVDGDGDEQPTTPIPVNAAPSWRPSTAEVAAQIPLRVRDEPGNVLTDFTNDGKTRPSRTQVERIVTGAVKDTVTAVGTLENCSADNVSDLREGAKDAATLRAAMRVERTFFPDQIGSDLSAYEAIRDELKEKLKTLVEAVSENCGTSGGDSASGRGQMPVSDFPEATPYRTAAW